MVTDLKTSPEYVRVWAISDETPGTAIKGVCQCEVKIMEESSTLQQDLTTHLHMLSLEILSIKLETTRT